MDQIKQSNINPAHFKAVCYTLSMYGDYASGMDIRPSWLTVAREAGVNRKTAMKVRDYLISQEVLIQIRKTEANIAEYKFGSCPKVDKQLSNLEEQLSYIGGHNTTINTTNNNKAFGFKKSEEVSLDLKHSSLTNIFGGETA
jgi:hypothetical protein